MEKCSYWTKYILLHISSNSLTCNSKYYCKQGMQDLISERHINFSSVVVKWNHLLLNFTFFFFSLALNKQPDNFIMVAHFKQENLKNLVSVLC